MPAQVQMFDTRAKPVHSFGAQHRNFLLYQPQGRLLLSAGFGNLAGGIDIWEVSTRKKVAEFKCVIRLWHPGFKLTGTEHPTRPTANGLLMVTTSSRPRSRHVCESTMASKFGGVVVSYFTFIIRTNYTRLHSSQVSSPTRPRSLRFCLVHPSRILAWPFTDPKERPVMAVSRSLLNGDVAILTSR